jgi:glycosyltransferase 2 family protein
LSYDPSLPGTQERSTGSSRRRLLRDFLGVFISVVSLGAFVWWATHQRRPQFPSSPKDIGFVVLAVALYGLATLLRGWRWHRILLRAAVDHKRSDAFALTAVGYMGNTILPARGGEVLRILLLGERSHSSRREIFGTIVAERLLDVVALVLLFGALSWSGVAGTHEGKFPAAIGLLAIVAAAIALVFYIRLRKRGLLERFAASVRPFVRASRLLFGRLGLALLALTCGIWFLEGVIFWLIGDSLELGLNVLEGTFLVALTSFFLLIPAAPGYIGTFDSALVVGLRAVGVTGGQALAFVLLARFVLFVPVSVVGLVLMFTRYGGLRWLSARRNRRSRAEGHLSSDPVQKPVELRQR